MRKRSVSRLLVTVTSGLAACSVVLGLLVALDGGGEIVAPASAAGPHILPALATTSAGLADGPSIPAGVILVWPGQNGSIPSGFVRETSLDGRFIKGTADGVNPDVTGGSATHTHTSPGHTHTVNGHNHSGSTSSTNHVLPDSWKSDDGESDVLGAGNHTHSFSTTPVNNTTTSNVAVTYSAYSNNPPYTDVIFIRSTGTSSPMATDAVALFADASLPSGYQLADGTNGTLDLRNRYLRGAAAGQDAGTTGGGTTNSHAIDHTHTDSHGHTAATGGASGAGNVRQSGANTPMSMNTSHTHPITLNAGSFTSTTNTAIAAQSESVEPAYKKLLAVANKTGGSALPTGAIGIWLGPLGSIPGGWRLCDGTDDAPDMRGWYFKAAATAGEIDNTGGSNTHTHAAQSHSHNGNSHTHTGSVGQATENIARKASGNQQQCWGGPNSNVQPNHTLASCSSVAYTYTSANTTANAASNEPEYRTVAFIQYVNNPPSDPSDPSPAHNSYISNNTPLCSWTASTDFENDPISYIYTLSANSNLSSPLVDHVDVGSNTSYQNATLGEGTYYWQALAFDGTSFNSNPAIWSFTVDTLNPGALLFRGMHCDFTAGQIDQLNGTGEDGTTLAFYECGGTPVAGTPAWDGNGAWTFTPGSPLDPDRCLYAIAEDQASNLTSSRSYILSFQAVLDVFRDDAVFHGGAPGSSLRLELDTTYRFKIAVNGGIGVTVSAWLRKDAAYAGAAPSITLTGLGITGTGLATSAMSAGADTWQQLSVTGTPNADGLLTLTVETFSTSAGSAWIDDISVSQ